MFIIMINGKMSTNQSYNEPNNYHCHVIQVYEKFFTLDHTDHTLGYHDLHTEDYFMVVRF